MLPKVLTQFAKSALATAGLEVHRITTGVSFPLRLAQTLQFIQAELVMDVGANKGQFASEIRAAGYGGQIVSFEPLADAHACLTKQAVSDARWTVHPRAAVGDNDGTIEINVSANSVSSSILDMKAAHTSAHEASRYVGTESVPILRLDSVLQQYNPSTRRHTFLKIDTQGYEWQVLDGATETLKTCGAILLEASLIELYAGQKLWMDLINRMAANEFDVWSIDRGFFNRQTGQTLQCDIVFAHRSVIAAATPSES
jgi:FkbM family methyltransferase